MTVSASMRMTMSEVVRASAEFEGGGLAAVADVDDAAGGVLVAVEDRRGDLPGGVGRPVVGQDHADRASVPAGGEVDGQQRVADDLFLVVGGNDDLNVWPLVPDGGFRRPGELGHEQEQQAAQDG